ncbi:Protein PIN-LIKES 3 [Bienertia sinuspersici]
MVYASKRLAYICVGLYNGLGAWQSYKGSKARNLGNLPYIILPAMCKEKGSPFGAPDVCERYGLAYASLSMAQVKVSSKIKQRLRMISKEFNLKAVLAPSTIGAMVGFLIGMISPLRKLLMDNNAPLHVVGDTSFMIGDAAIPCTTLILGANLLRGLKGSGIQVTTIIGIIAVRYIFLPLLGILVVKGAVLAGFLKSHDIFFQFVLLLQYALPPAVSIGTVTELFGAGQKECSVIMLWTNVLAPVTLTFWCTFFLWLLT